MSVQVEAGIAYSEESVISTDELRRRLADPTLTIVDVRPLAAYNGWQLEGEARGGHIPGAVAFPSAWLDSVDDDELERLLDSKEIESPGSSTYSSKPTVTPSLPLITVPNSRPLWRTSAPSGLEAPPTS